MEFVQQIFALALSLFKYEFTLFGYTLSAWEVFIWSIVAGIVIWFFKEAFS